MRSNLFRTLFLLILSFPPASAFAADWNPSGFYDGFLQIAVDPKTQMVTGYYLSQTGLGPDGGPMFTCLFYLRGKKEGERASIQAYYPMDKDPRPTIPGEIKFSFDKAAAQASLWLKLQEPPAGSMACPGVKEGEELTRDSASEGWIEIRVIKAKRAHFFDSPEAPGPRKAYVVRDDGIQVLENRPGWVLATFGGKSKGWLREEDLYPK